MLKIAYSLNQLFKKKKKEKKRKKFLIQKNILKENKIRFYNLKLLITIKTNTFNYITKIILL